MVTLLQLRTQIRQRVNMVNSLAISDSELNSYINNSTDELYALLIKSYQDYFITISFVNITSGNTFSLPSDFNKLRGLDLKVGDGYCTVPRLNFEQHNDYKLGKFSSIYLGRSGLYYVMLGNIIYIYPEDAAVGTYRLIYVPQFQDMVNDSDTMIDLMGFDEYVIVDSAIKCRDKEESDCSVLMAQKQALIVRIKEEAINRDANMPETIHSLSRWQGDRW